MTNDDSTAQKTVGCGYGPMDIIPQTNAAVRGVIPQALQSLTQEEHQMTHNQQIQNVTMPSVTLMKQEEAKEHVSEDYQDGMKLKDSGDRREFESGAHRDMAKGKGRCDLLPMTAIEHVLPYEYEPFLSEIHAYQQSGDIQNLIQAVTRAFELKLFKMPDAVGFSRERVKHVGEDEATILLEVAKHFEAGAEKYGDNNWQKGIPTSVYIDSAIRHLLKFIRGDRDEPHNRAFIWNLLCCLWTEQNKPGCRSYAK